MDVLGPKYYSSYTILTWFGGPYAIILYVGMWAVCACVGRAGLLG